ncbi:hypothetical protein BGP77_06230 [Saccharospirillum sp. MSK14-1]|uniref:glycine zipper 2TM domain-containing protein n=1 Tax=Saccharospirillum sp. MSK14-1 TaxID=1897632 RepID=UPI000D3C8D54|nr:glycine zipper 2TM domain-containing protein [Saccharospirillum sp. MSK14-1]PTY36879.1 hypothetical protein BGP77_06230 [Saccharospirillum sp. MSK14-1]
MKTIRLLTLTLALGASSAAMADHYRDHYRYSDRQHFYADARVVYAEPIYETYYYRDSGSRYEICRTRDVEVERYTQNNGNPGAAIIGGALGATVGSNAGHSPESQIFGAIAGGIIGGAIGHELGGGKETVVRYRTERQCEVEYRHHRRELIGYEVRYRYNGREFTTIMDRHPGRYVQLEVEVTPR